MTTMVRIGSCAHRLSGSSAQALSLLLAGLLLLAGCGGQDTKKLSAAARNCVERVAERGPVKLTVRVSPREPRLSDTLALEMLIESEPGVEITPPAFGRSVGEFAIRDYNDTAGKPGESAPGKQLRVLRYQLEPMRAGPHLIRAVTVVYKEPKASAAAGKPDNAAPAKDTPDGKKDAAASDKKEAAPETAEQLLETEPFEIEVTSELKDKVPSLGNLASMRPPEPLPPSPFWKWAGAALLLALAGGVALYLRNRYRKHIEELLKPPTPEEIAHRELKYLLSENLPGKQLYKEFYVRLTGIVRRYIEGTTGLRAPEQTTEEFLRDMREKRIFPHERSEQLARFLESADLVKYAAQEPSERQLEETIARAQEFVGLPSAFSPAAGPALAPLAQPARTEAR